MSDNKNQIYLFRLFKISLGLIILFLAVSAILFAQDNFQYDARGKRNPFIPLVSADGRLLRLDKEEVQGDLTVEGIIFDKHGGSFAIVNGTVVGVSDKISDYQVLKIFDDKVIFIKDGRISEVEIKKEGQE